MLSALPKRLFSADAEPSHCCGTLRCAAAHTGHPLQLPWAMPAPKRQQSIVNRTLVANALSMIRSALQQDDALTCLLGVPQFGETGVCAGIGGFNVLTLPVRLVFPLDMLRSARDA
ncbi:unnamed protein product [Symbiodinium sp. CCMP2592]|nr:unnamed protein product [Symbiodinium sp. CCMP2592]